MADGENNNTKFVYKNYMEQETSPLNSAVGIKKTVVTYGSYANNSVTDVNSSLEARGQHCHRNDVRHERLDKRAIRKLIIASILCMCFMIIEVAGGVVANSLAIATDAAHLLTDFASFMISLFALHVAARAPSKKMSFGWYRAEVMGALVSVLMIWLITGVLVYLAIRRVINEDYEINATIMLITSGCGVAFNIIMAACLGHGHSHGSSGTHNHRHQTMDNNWHIHSSSKHKRNHDIEHERVNLLPKEQSSPTSESHENINVKAAFVHVIGDFLQSLGVLIAAYIIYYKPEWKIADPICTFLFSVLVMFTTFTILRDTVGVLMEATPRDMSYTDTKNTLLTIEGVMKVHNLHLWSLSTNKCALAVHVVVEKQKDTTFICSEAAALMQKKYGIIDCTIQIEEYESEMSECADCEDPED